LLFLIIGIIVIIFLWKNRNMSVKIKGFQAKKKNLHSVEQFTGDNDIPARQPEENLNYQSSYQSNYNSSSPSYDDSNYDQDSLSFQYNQNSPGRGAPLTIDQYKNHASSFAFNPTLHKDYSSASDHPVIKAHYNNLNLHKDVINEVVIIEPVLISTPDVHQDITYKKDTSLQFKHPRVKVDRNVHDESISVKHPFGKYNIVHETVAKPFTRSSNFSLVSALGNKPVERNSIIDHHDVANHFIHKKAEKHRELHHHHKAHENTIRSMLFRPKSPNSDDEYED
jgi:hypothetical protein